MTHPAPTISVIIRPAQATEQGTIRAMVRAAHLNPLDLQWQHFLVAEWQGQIVGVGQIRPHGDGCRELASIAVLPAHQGQGIGARIVRALQAREAGPLYLMCAAEMVRFYEPFGFQRVEARSLPRSLRWKVRLGQFLARIIAWTGTDAAIAAMRWQP